MHVGNVGKEPHLEEDNIEEGAGGDALHDGHADRMRLGLAGGRVQHGHAHPGPQHRGQGEHGDVECHQTAVHLPASSTIFIEKLY